MKLSHYTLLGLSIIALLFVLSSETKGNIFCEELTTTTCKACPDVSTILHEIYTSGDYPFAYVSMVADRNDDAAERTSDYNVYGYPTTVFDGGYSVIFGKQPKINFENTVQTLLNRVTSDIVLAEEVIWKGHNELDIYVTIRNDEATEYDGILKIYIVEPVSRWKNNDGDYYHFGFIGYATDELFSLASGESVQQTYTFNSTLASGIDISKDNIMAIAVIFDAEDNIGYSDPPENQRPFTAHYVDACEAERPLPDAPPVLEFITVPHEMHGYRNCSFEWYGWDDSGILQYKYKLDPFENNWNSYTDNVTNQYRNLSDGSYTFLLEGKDSIGQIKQISYSFSIDTRNPSVTSTNPRSDAKNVAVYTPITLKFSHPMNTSSVENGLAITPHIPYTIQWLGHSELIIQSQSLNYETDYTVTLRNIKRTSGQLAILYSFSFSTSSEDVIPPDITRVSPFNSELIDVIEIIFSEPMDVFLHNAIILNPRIDYTVNWIKNDTELLLSFDDLAAGIYNITITTYITDKNKNFMNDNYSFSVFVTNPTVLYTSIDDGEKNVDANASLVITFSHKMDRSSVEESISLSPLAPYQITWDGNDAVISFSLENGQKYTFKISEGATDTRNIPLQDNTSLSFTTIESFKRDDTPDSQTPAFTTIMILIAMFVGIAKKLRLKPN